MLLSAVVLAVATDLSTRFFHDFGGRWTCGNAAYHSEWSIASPDGNAWTIVQYGADARHPDGTAYVGYVPATGAYVYNDFHNDGGLAQLRAAVPSDGVWRWTGTYYASGSKTPDNGPDIIWARRGDAIERTFRKNENGKLVETGRDRCVTAGS